MWVDLEMTGLDPATDLILEVAVIVTDGDLERLIEGPSLVLEAPREALAAMAPVVREMHAESGLTRAVAQSTTTVEDAQAAVVEFLSGHLSQPGVAPLAGNSVHADRAFLERYMPEVVRWLHYRNVDVSTLKELAKRWHPQALEQAPEKAGGHRALDDIRESIEELRYYRAALFREA